MKTLSVSLLLLGLVTFRVHAEVIGSESFTYSNAAVDLKNGGTGFDLNQNNTHSGVPSDWNKVTGSPLIVDNALVTNNQSAKREFNGNTETTGARSSGRVFFKFSMTRAAGNGAWGGVSSYGFNTERIFFGVPSPGAGNDLAGIDTQNHAAADLPEGTVKLSSISLADGVTHTLVGVIDFDNNLLGLFVNPDATDFWNPANGANSADATLEYLSVNASTSARAGSGATVTWDNLVLATTAADVGLLEFFDADQDDDGMPDVWETSNGLVVGTDDSALDTDGDNLSNLEEYQAGTNPQEVDTDGDSYQDDVEITAGTNPTNANSHPNMDPALNVIGIENFDYPDGSISGLTGGLHWDFDNSTENDAFFGHTGSLSDWDSTGGAPQLVGGVLVTQDSNAKREYNGPGEGAQAGSDERFGSVSDDVIFDQHAVYYRFEMTRRAGATWAGASSFDFGAERYLFGVPGAANPISGQREFAIHDLNTNNHAYSGIQPVLGQTYTLVAKLDFDNNIAALYLNPNLSQSEQSNNPVAVYAHTSGNWSSGIRFGSGGNGQVEWDNLRVATTWDGLQEQPPVANDDAITMNHLTQARIQVTANDSGSIHRGSLALVTPPTFGAATVSPDGSILYQHSSGQPTTDSFVYQVVNPSGSLTDTGVVTISFTANARFDSNFVTLPATPPATATGITDAFPGLTFDSPHAFCSIPGDSQKILVTEGDGRVFLIPNITANPVTKTPIVDVTNRTSHDNNEKAFKGIAAHPNWSTNGYIYVTYNSTSGTSRLSRFTCQTTAPFTADPASEQILIDQVDPDAYHNIGSCEFGADGYLYVGFGDGGTQSDGHSNSQYIDKHLWSGILRLDVDRQPANLVPNPDSDIPRVGGGSTGEAYFRVPTDNPFVGATSFNGVTVDPAEVRTELFVVGLRNPWQFSVEDLDRNGTVDEVWVGDVGRNDREEIGVYQAGNNGGWSWKEGNFSPGGITGDRNGAIEANATLVAPLWEYNHGGGTFQGNSVTGGLIYQGNAIPSLTGKYIFADYVSGHIWSLERTTPTPTVERIDGEAAIVGLMTDPSTGDILLLDRGNTGNNQGVGSIKRLAVGTNDSGYPQTLSQTNFFSDLSNLTTNPGGVGYTPNLRFWSDHAEKSRWFLIKDTASSVSYSRDDPWDYPEGMIWVKHFDYPTEWESFTRSIDGVSVPDRRPVFGSPRRRVETRFLVRTATGSYGLSYRWNHLNAGTQTDAALASKNGESFDIAIRLNGSPTVAPWQIPSRNSCTICHTPEAGHALSFNTRQLNAPGTLAGDSANFLSLLSNAGYLTGLAENPASLPRHLRPDETTYSLEARVRSYLDVNCSYCHQAGGTGGGNWDGRSHLTLAQTGLVNGHSLDAPLHPEDRLVLPGEVSKSILYNRAAAANGYSRMPPIATNEIDLEGVQLLSAWIAGEVQPHASYQEWRVARFGNGTSSEGASGADPDGDGGDNHFEWLTNTDPEDSTSFWRPSIQQNGNSIAHDFTGLGNRSATLMRSDDLHHWTPWQVPGNDGIPRAAGVHHSLIGPMMPGNEFFRFEIQER
ncbi:MAG: PQQ-dependent sugar dehydrogenase [Verrucomicrobiota bacterium]